MLTKFDFNKSLKSNAMSARKISPGSGSEQLISSSIKQKPITFADDIEGASGKLASGIKEETIYRVDQWHRSVEKIYESLQVPFCVILKIAMVLLNVSTTCVFLATCLIVSLKLILVTENGFISGDEASSSSLLMLFGLLFMGLVSWSFATTVIISRQLEVLLLVIMTPSSLISLNLAKSASEETDPMKQPFLRFTPISLSKVPFPRFPILSFATVIMVLFGIMTLALYSVGNSDAGTFFLIWFLMVLGFITIWFTPNPKSTESIIHTKMDLNRPGLSMVSYAFFALYIFLCLGGFFTSILFLTSENYGSGGSYGGTPGFAVIVLGFVATSVFVNLFQVVRESWINPVYYIWVEFTLSITKTEKVAKFYKYMILGTVVLLSVAAVIFGFISFIIFMSNGDQESQRATAFTCEFIFCIINIFTILAAIVVYANAKSTTSNDYNKLEAANETQTSTHSVDEKVESKTPDSLSVVKESAISVILTAFKGINDSSGWLMTDFIFFIFMIAGLSAGSAAAATWTQAIGYFLIASILMCASYYAIETKSDNNSYLDEFWKILQVFLMITSLVLIIFIFPSYGCGIASVFFILAFTQGYLLLLYDMLLSAPFDLVSKNTRQKNLKIFAGFTKTAVAEFGTLQVRKYNDRLFKGVYGLAVILNAVAFLLSAFAETSTFFGAGSGAATVVSPLDVNASTTPQYGLCSEKLYGLNPIDTTYLVALTYFKDPTNYSYDCGYYNPNNLKTCLDHYFTQTYTNPSTNNKPYNWEVLNVTIPKSSRSDSKTAYYGIKSDNANLIVVGVRGSTTGRDWLEDFNLYVEVTMLQAFSLIIPYLYVWPVAATNRFVKALSFIDTMTLLSGNRSYYEPVVDYIAGLQLQYPKFDFAVIGHSLGGATSGIVGAKMNIRSFNVEPPGTIYSAMKFQISNGLQPIHQSSTSIVRDYDPVPMVDLQVIMLQQ